MSQTVRNPDQTRHRLLEAAFDEIYLNGYQGMRVDDILRRTGLKKGALYHHFAGKAEIAYAVIDELILNIIQQTWIAPLQGCDNPIDCIWQILVDMKNNPDYDYTVRGCPLNNLAQEMSSLDEEFRIRINHLLDLWLNTFDQALARGQANGSVRNDIDSTAMATFLVASMEGSISLIKASRDEKTIMHCMTGIEFVLNSLRDSAHDS